MEAFEENAIIEDGLATLITKKTDEEICVDLKDDYTRLLTKYNGKLPRQYHRNVVNREIKLIVKPSRF